MTLETGTTVRTVIDLLASDGSILPIGSIATVIGSVDDRFVIVAQDHDTGEPITAEAHCWECITAEQARRARG